MAQLPPAFSCHLSSAASRLVPLGCTAKSTIVVVPPQAAARVPVSKLSTEKVPPNGISMWVCASIPPGSTYLPAASMTVSAAAAHAAAASLPGWPSAAICSPLTRTSAANVPLVVMTVPPVIRMLIAPRASLPLGESVPPGEPARSGLRQRAVGVGPPVPVDRPQVADLLQQAEIQVAHDHLVVAVGARVTDQLTAR